MKKIKLSTLENKYYYGISRYFWHIVIGMAVIGVTIGLLTFFWSEIPVFKENVVQTKKPIKKEYPKQKKVNLNSLINALPKGNIPKQKEQDEVVEIDEHINYDDKPPVTKIDSFAIANFERELGYTKSLIPYSKYKSFWEGTGSYKFKDGERGKKLYKMTHNPKYRVWVSNNDNFKGRYLNYANRNKLKEYNTKTELLNGINNLLAKLSLTNRKKLVENYLLYIPVKKIGLTKTKNIYNKVGKLVAKIDSTKQIQTFNKIYKFVINNPNDGLDLIDYETSIIDNIAVAERPKFIKTIQNEYRNNFNNNLYSLKEATNQFIPFLDKIPSNKQSIALRIFYTMYRDNNSERIAKIREIDNQHSKAIQDWQNDFNRRVSEAENKYYSKKRLKKELRTWSYKGIGISFVVILVISLFLLILSMVRNVNKLSEAILENNKLFSENITDIKKQIKEEKE